MSDLAPTLEAPVLDIETEDDPHDGPILPVLALLLAEIAVYTLMTLIAFAALSILE